MKKFWPKAVAVTIIGGAAFAQAADSSGKSRKESPFACNPFALSSEQRTRHFDELGPALRSLKKSVQELTDGYEFEFPGDLATLRLLTEWTIQERQCCPFFDINLRLEPEGGSL